MNAHMTPNSVYRPKTGSWPLLYQWWVEGSDKPFKLDGCLPGESGWWEMYLIDQNVVGGERIVTLAGNPISYDTPSGIWRYRLTLGNESAITTLAVIAYTYEKVLVGDKTILRVADFGPGWRATAPILNNYATIEFSSIAITAIERTHFATRCDCIDLMDWSGPGGAPIPGHIYHAEGRTLDGRYVRKADGTIDEVWFTHLVNQTRKLTVRPIKYWINDKWYATTLLPSIRLLFPKEVQAICDCLNPSDQYGGHKDHWHLTLEA